MNSSQLFTDNFKFNLPQSLILEGCTEIKWLRPEQYIKECHLDEKLKKVYPNKNVIKLRSMIKLLFNNSKNIKKRRMTLFAGVGTNILEDRKTI